MARAGAFLRGFHSSSELATRARTADSRLRFRCRHPLEQLNVRHQWSRAVRFDKYTGLSGAAAPAAVRRVLLMTHALLSVSLIAGFWLHHRSARSASTLAEFIGFTLFIAVLWTWMLWRSHAGRSAAVITPDTVADWLPAAIRG